MQQVRKYLRPLILSLALAILVYLAVALSLDWERSYHALGALSGATWLVICLLTLASFALRGVRWHAYMALLGHSVPFLRDLSIYLAGFAFTTTPGKVGEAVRSFYLKRYDVPYAHSFAALIVERMLDVVTIVALSGLCLLAFSAYRLPIAGFVLVLAALLVAARSERLQAWIAGKVAGAASAKIKSLGGHVVDLLQAVQALLKSGPLLAGLALGIVAWGAQGWGFSLILHALGAEIAWPVAIGIYAIAILAGAVSFIPGGLGSTEAVMGGSLVLLGIDMGTAVAATLICRLVTLWPAVLIGVGFLLALEGTASSGGPLPAKGEAGGK